MNDCYKFIFLIYVPVSGKTQSTLMQLPKSTLDEV